MKNHSKIVKVICDKSHDFKIFIKIYLSLVNKHMIYKYTFEAEIIVNKFAYSHFQISMKFSLSFERRPCVIIGISRVSLSAMIVF